MQRYQQFLMVMTLCAVMLISAGCLPQRLQTITLRADEMGVVYERNTQSYAEPLLPATTYTLDPALQLIYFYPTFVQNYAFLATSDESNLRFSAPSITIESQDGIAFQLDMSISYRLNPQTIVDFHQRWYGKPEDFRADLIRVLARRAARNTFAQFSAEALNTRRGRNAALNQLEETLRLRFENNQLLFEHVTMLNLRQSAP